VGGKVAQQQISDDGPPADEKTIKVIGGLLDVSLTGCEVDV
jgi:hypothetical protein